MKLGYVRADEQHKIKQINAIKDYGVDEIYEDTNHNKQQLLALLGNLRAGDTLVVWKLEQLGRTIKQLLALAKDFEKKGIALVTINDNMENTVDALCALSRMERNVLNEKTIDGMAAVRKKGRNVGRKPSDKKDVEKALQMYYSNNYAIKEIIEATGLGRTTLYKYIREHDSKNNGKG